MVIWDKLSKANYSKNPHPTSFFLFKGSKQFIIPSLLVYENLKWCMGILNAVCATGLEALRLCVCVVSQRMASVENMEHLQKNTK